MIGTVAVLALVGGLWLAVGRSDNGPVGSGSNEGATDNEAVPRRNTDNRATDAQVAATKDIFGIPFIQPTIKGGTYWLSNWGGRRDFTGVVAK